MCIELGKNLLYRLIYLWAIFNVAVSRRSSKKTFGRFWQVWRSINKSVDVYRILPLLLTRKALQLLAHEIYSQVWIVYTDQIGGSDFNTRYAYFDSGETVFLKENTKSGERRTKCFKRNHELKNLYGEDLTWQSPRRLLL